MSYPTCRSTVSWIGSYNRSAALSVQLRRLRPDRAARRRGYYERACCLRLLEPIKLLGVRTVAPPDFRFRLRILNTPTFVGVLRITRWLTYDPGRKLDRAGKKETRGTKKGDQAIMDSSAGE